MFHNTPYCGNAYRKLLHDHQAVRSQSRRGNCQDKAQAENRRKVLGAAGRASEPKYSKAASGPFLLTYPTPMPASLNMLITILTERLHARIDYQPPYPAQ